MEEGAETVAYYSRKSPRIPNFDYSSDHYYFVTICTHNRRCLFGEPEHLNSWGQIARNQILQIEEHYSNIKVDQFVVMPNHVHMILVVGCGAKAEKNPNLSQIIAQLKSGISREIRKSAAELTVWQRSFHDHVIRTQKDYEKIWLYIQTNPQRWDKDCFYIDPAMC